jgi:hypothetical protein
MGVNSSSICGRDKLQFLSIFKFNPAEIDSDVQRAIKYIVLMFCLLFLKPTVSAGRYNFSTHETSAYRGNKKRIIYKTNFYSVTAVISYSDITNAVALFTAIETQPFFCQCRSEISSRDDRL